MMVPLLLGYKLKMLAIADFNFISESSLKKKQHKEFFSEMKSKQSIDFLFYSYTTTKQLKIFFKESIIS